MLNVAIFLLLFFYSALLASVPLPQSVTVGDYEYKDLNNVIVGSGGIFPGGSLFGWSDILFTTARAFDSMGCMINGTQFVANEPIDLLAGNRYTGQRKIDNMKVMYSTKIKPTRPQTLRTIITLNSTINDNVEVIFGTNSAYDSTFQIVLTSNGDSNFEESDFWVYSNFGSSDPSVSIFLSFGDGSIKTSHQSTIVFNSSGNEGVCYGFTVDLEAYSPKSLLFFHEIIENTSTPDPSKYQNLDTVRSGDNLLHDLSPTEILEIYNWDTSILGFSQSTTRTPTPSITLSNGPSPVTLTFASSPALSLSTVHTQSPSPSNSTSSSGTPSSSTTISRTMTATKSPSDSPSNTRTPTRTQSISTTSSPSKSRSSSSSSSATRTPTPTGTSTGSGTVSPTSSPSSSPTPTTTPTTTPTSTGTSSSSRTSSTTPSRTASSSRSSSNSISPSRTASRSSSRTSSPSRTATESISESNTPTDSLSSTKSISKTPSVTSSITPTISETPSSSSSISLSSSSSKTRTPSQTSSISPTRTPSPSNTGSISETPSTTSSKSESNTSSRSKTETPSTSRTPSRTSSITRSATRSKTPSISDSATNSQSRSSSKSITVSKTPSVTSTDTSTMSPTTTPSNTLTATMTTSSTPTASPLPSNTATPSSTVSVSPTSTLTITSTNTPSSTQSPTSTPTPTNTPTSTPPKTPSSTISTSSSVSITLSESLIIPESITPSKTSSKSDFTLELLAPTSLPSIPPSNSIKQKTISKTSFPSCNNCISLSPTVISFLDNTSGGGILRVGQENTISLATVSIPDDVEALLPLGTKLNIQEAKIYNVQGPLVVSDTALDITLTDITGNEIKLPGGEVELCFTVSTSSSENDMCLGFINEDNEWECVDECIELNEDGQYCGETDHFTSFAMLLNTSNDGNSNGCESSNNGITWITYLSIASVGLALLIILTALFVGEILFRIKQKKKNDELQRFLDKTQQNMQDT